MSAGRAAGAVRQIILRRSLVAVAAGASLVCATVLAAPASRLSTLWPVLVAIGVIAALTRLVTDYIDAVAWVFSVIVCASICYVISLAGWPPAVVIACCVGITFIALVAGRQAATATCLCASATLFAGAADVRLTDFTPEIPAISDMESFGNWIRVTLVFTFGLMPPAIILYSTVRELDATEGRLAAAVEQGRAQLAQVQTVRATRRGIEEALQRTQRLASLKYLGRGLSHVFNNILTVLRSSIEEARSARDTEGALVALQEISLVLERSSTRAHDILMLARVTPESLVTVSIDEEVQLRVDDLRRTTREDVELECELQAGAEVRLSSVALRQIMTNLVLNAQNAMRGAGRICIRTECVDYDSEMVASQDTLEAGRYVAIRVSDDGPGLSPDVAAEAFAPFFTTADRSDHDGLGLTVVLQMARGFGGTAEFTRVSGGAEVTVYLLVVTVTEARPFNLVPTDVAPWKPGALRTLFRANFFVVAAVLLATVVMRMKSPMMPVVYGVCIPAVGAYGWLGWAGGPRRLSADRLAHLLMSLVLPVGAATTFVLGFMAPAPVAYLAFGTLVCASLLGRTAVLFVCALNAATFLAAGWAHTSGWLPTSEGSLLPTYNENWKRIAINLPLVAWLSGMGAARIPSLLTRRVQELERVEAELQASRLRFEDESDRLQDLEALEQRARDLEQGGRFTATIAHDINNSLQSIALWLELLVDVQADPSILDECIDGIEEAAHYIEALITQLDQGDGESVREAVPLDLVHAIHRMLHMLEAAAGEQVSVKLQVAGRGHVVRVDEQALRRAMLNLVTNARDAIQQRTERTTGECAITVTREEQCVRIDVADNGAGMSVDTQERVMDPFFTTKRLGTGLGLHSVADTVRAANGRFRLNSEPGCGTTISLWLPACTSPPVVRQPTAPQAAFSAAGEVLLVEDDALVRRLLARGLRRVGFSVVEACDGDDALIRLEQDADFVALCTDGVMPGAPADEVVREFERRYPGRPILLMSGYLPRELDERLIGRDGVVYLRKPLTARRLAEELSRRAGTSA